MTSTSVTHRRRRILLASALAGVLTAALALSWLTGTLANPLRAAEDALILLVIPPTALAWLVLVTAAIGAFGAVAVLRRDTDDPSALLIAVAVPQIVVFGFAVQGMGTIALAGYLVAFAVPAAGLVLAVQVVRRYPRLRVVVAAGLLVVTAWGTLSGTLRPTAVGRLLGSLATGFTAAAQELVAVLLFTASAAGWILVLLDSVGRTGTADRLTDVVVRHRRTFTVIAALGPLPYALARATWLTPWPMFGGPIADLSPETRLWGVLLGAAAVSGSVLTIGLIRPWGEVFPRWLPGLAGQPVPVAAAAVPGGIVAAIVTAAAVPVLVGMSTSDLGVVDKALAILLFPFWLWGPMLALAVWGYVGHRSRVSTTSSLAR